MFLNDITSCCQTNLAHCFTRALAMELDTTFLLQHVSIPLSLAFPLYLLSSISISGSFSAYHTSLYLYLPPFLPS